MRSWSRLGSCFAQLRGSAGLGERCNSTSFPGKYGLLVLLVCQAVVLIAYYLLLSNTADVAVSVMVLFLPFLLGTLVVVLSHESYATTFFVLAATLAGLGFLPGSPGLNTVYVVFLMLAYVVANLSFRLVGAGDVRLKGLPIPFGSLFLVLAVALLVSTLVAGARGLLNVGLITGVVTFLLSGLAVWYLAGCFSDEGRLVKVIYSVILIVTVASVVWLPAAYGAIGKRMTMPFQSVAVGLNEVGGSLAMLAVLAMGLLVLEEKPARRVALGIAFLVLVLGLILTKSRGAWVGAIAGLAYILIRARRTKILLFFLVAIPLVVALLEPIKATFVARLTQTEAGDPAWLGRVFMWQTALRIIPKNLLFGIGLHNFGVVKYDYGFPRFLDPLDVSFSYRPNQVLFGHTHNLYVELLMGIGVIGFAAFLLIILLTVVNLNRIAGTDRETKLKGPALGLAALLIAYMTHSFFDYLLWIVYSLVVFATFLGLSLVVVKLDQEGSRAWVDRSTSAVTRSQTLR